MVAQDIISTLNDLIATCKDGEAGFKACAEDASDLHPHLKSMLQARQRECAAAASELQEMVRLQGGTPTTSSTIGGTLHRGWMDIKTAIAGKNDEAVLNECERGEDVAVKNYRDALEKDLPPHVKQLIERQYLDVQRNHDQIKSMRDQARAHR